MTSQSASLSSAPIVQAQPRRRTLQQSQRLWGFIFLSPWIAGFLIFTLFPMLTSLYFSFTNFTIGKEIQWIGLTNWIKLFQDPSTLNSLGVTLRFGLIALPVGILLPLTLASLLNSRWLIARPLFRIFFYMPYIIPAISGVFVWQSFLNGQTGWLNRILRSIGVQNPPNWLFDPIFLNTGLVLIGVWGIGNAMLTMMASMQGVPTELYEAARVDGANPWTLFRKITLPMISPVLFYNLVLGVIGLMQYFTVPYVLSTVTRSNPNTYFINLHLYRTAFQFQDMGYASAIAWFIFILGLGFTVFLFATSRRWVYYTSGD